MTLKIFKSGYSKIKDLGKLLFIGFEIIR